MERAASLLEEVKAVAAQEEAWYGRPKADRMRYTGNYVAVVEGDVVDQDPDQRALVLRMRAWSQPALIVLADWDAPPKLIIPNIHLIGAS